MNILITGGAGFIGSNLALELLSDNVVTIDDYSLGSPKNLIKFSGIQYKGSILDLDLLNSIIKKHKIEEIYHLAAASASPMFYENLIHSMNVNIMGTLNVLECARHNNVRKVVYATTSSIYGDNQLPFDESKLDITTFYPLTKYIDEHIAKLFTKERWVETTGCRFFSVYGPHDLTKGKYANFLTQFVWNMSNGLSPVVYDDGKQTRDFIYVKDICRGLIASMKCKEADGKVINLGTGFETNILDMIAIINKNLGTDIKPRYEPNPIKGYVKYTRSDTTLMKELLNFTPQVTLEEGIKLVIQSI